jgi:hypothetical protein
MGKNTKSTNTLANLDAVVAQSRETEVKTALAKMVKPDFKKVNAEFQNALTDLGVEMETVALFFESQRKAAETLNTLNLRQAEEAWMMRHMAQDPEYIRLQSQVTAWKKAADTTFYVGTVRVRSLGPNHPIRAKITEGEQKLAEMRNTPTMLSLKKKISKLLTLANREGYFSLLDDSTKGQ